MDGTAVTADELGDGGSGLRAQKRTETQFASHLEFGAKFSEDGELSTLELLLGGVRIAHILDVSASGVLTGTPTLANHGTDFVAEIAQDSHFHFTHNAFVLEVNNFVFLS